MDQLVLVINPLFSSTKIAVYASRKHIFLTIIKHSPEELSGFNKFTDQFEMRKKAICHELKNANIDIRQVGIVVGRGGLLKPISGGVYIVNEAMLRDSLKPMGEHESNLGGIIAYDMAKEAGKDAKAIIIDPACVDEMEEIAKISGIPEIKRKSILHALNQRTVARNFVREIGKNYEDINVIVAHLGKSISIGVHQKGRIIDVNNGLIGDGPMTTERSGSVPCGDLVEMCFSGKYSREDILKKLNGGGGILAYLGTNNWFEVEKRIESGDRQAELVFRAMAYQIAKEIGAMSTVLKGEIDGILITGEIAHCNYMINAITERIHHLGMVRVYPGEDEMEAQAMYAYMVLTGEIEAKEYK